MSRDDEFGIIQVENLQEDFYKSLGVLNVWLLINKYMDIIQSKYIYNIIGRKTQLTVILLL